MRRKIWEVLLMLNKNVLKIFIAFIFLLNLSELSIAKGISEMEACYLYVCTIMSAASTRGDYKEFQKFFAIAQFLTPLVESGSTTMNSQNKKGETVLMVASEVGELGTIEFILDKFTISDINIKTNDGWTALMYASMGHEDIVKLLIDKGSEVNAKTNEGLTSLTVAAENGHTEIVKLLLAKNADPNVKTENGWTVLMYVSQHGHNDVIKALLGGGAKIEEKTKGGLTALMIASSNNQPETVRLLIAKGADIKAKDNDGWTALTWAAYKKHDDIVKILEPYAKTNLDYAYLASYYQGKGDNKKTDDYIERAVRINPNSSDVRFIQGNIFYAKKDYDNAIVAYKKTVELNPKGDNTWRRLALCYKGKGDYKKALDSITNAIKIDPQDANYVGMQGEIYLYQKDIENAKSTYEKALELLLKDIEKEKTAGKYSNASWYALFIPRYSDAERYAKECLTMDSKMYELYTNLGHSYLFQGKKSEALIEYRKYIEQDPEKGITKFVNVLKDDFTLLKKRYPDKTSLIEWAEKELGIGK